MFGLFFGGLDQQHSNPKECFLSWYFAPLQRVKRPVGTLKGDHFLFLSLELSMKGAILPTSASDLVSFPTSSWSCNFLSCILLDSPRLPLRIFVPYFLRATITHGPNASSCVSKVVPLTWSELPASWEMHECLVRTSSGPFSSSLSMLSPQTKYEQFSCQWPIRLHEKQSLWLHNSQVVPTYQSWPPW